MQWRKTEIYEISWLCADFRDEDSVHPSRFLVVIMTSETLSTEYCCIVSVDPSTTALRLRGLDNCISKITPALTQGKALRKFAQGEVYVNGNNNRGRISY
ncbi:hypothetical protein E2C01_015487 [Portunus trituberculatus]|uniref:Uncharacterized protein n=1 Tax=Portunus trituberculatus TaxID=210409 RepID=A0A5B7DLN9_PORTR|nr:hypothetical protein [Portunus trituberculatus]